MIAAAIEPRTWPWRQRLGVVVLVFIVQLALIFALSSPPPEGPSDLARTLTFRYASRADLQAIIDPTLFTLPHPQRAPNPAPLALPPPDLTASQSSAPTNHPALPLDQLGTIFNRLAAGTEFNPLQLSIHTEAEPTLPPLLSLPLLAPRSTVQWEGALARRALLTPLELKSQTNRDLLTNTVVQLAVDADGLPVSVTLLSRSGSAEADQYGLEQARAVRFAPLARESVGRDASAALQTSWGKMVFRWHTIPESPASTPAPSP